MKKIIVIIAAALISAMSLFAQDAKSIYNKYSDNDKVSAVYVSPSMFKMMGKLPDLNAGDSNVNLSGIIQTLKGFYLLNSENPTVNKGLKDDVKKLTAKGDYDLLMEAKDSGETVRIYTVGNEKTVNNLVMFVEDGSEITFICLDGQIPRDKLEKVLAEQMN